MPQKKFDRKAIDDNPQMSPKPAKPVSDKITSFTGDYEFLSNEYKCDVKWPDIQNPDYIFQSAASLFWANKAIDIPGMFQKFTRLSPQKSRAKAANIPDTTNFEDMKEELLEEAVKLKFDSNPLLVKKLLKTGNAELINTVTHRDIWMGVRDGIGENMLGKILMKIRQEYKEKQR